MITYAGNEFNDLFLDSNGEVALFENKDALRDKINQRLKLFFSKLPDPF